MRSLKAEERKDKILKVFSDNIKYLDRKMMRNRVSDTENIKRNTQAQIAYQCGVKQSRVSLWKNGKALPSLLQVSILADIYHVSIDWLLADHSVFAYQHAREYKTYSDAFTAFLAFEPILVDDVHNHDLSLFRDPILKRLLTYHYRITNRYHNGSWSEENYIAWYQKVLEDFDIPITPNLPLEVFNFALDKVIRVESYDSLVATARFIADHPRLIDDERRRVLGIVTFSEWLNKEYPEVDYDRYNDEFVFYPYMTAKEEKLVRQKYPSYFKNQT